MFRYLLIKINNTQGNSFVSEENIIYEFFVIFFTKTWDHILVYVYKCIIYVNRKFIGFLFKIWKDMY